VSGTVVGSLLALGPVIGALSGRPPESLQLAWDVAHGPFQVGLDPLSASFLLPVLVLSSLCAVYGTDYLLAYRHEKSLGPPWFFLNIFVAGMILTLVARTVLVFLVAWEAMSLAAYFLVTLEHERETVRRAGWIYLVAAHLGVAFVLAALLLLGSHAGNLDFAAFRSAALSSGTASIVFVLALIGFGAKAGLVPLHVWLPEAHPAAPSHVSALMSGVMIKMGLYGLLRVLTFLPPPAAWWGLTLAAVGMVTALVGISLALDQRDIKRLLAYSSIENMGLITLSLGVGLWGQATGRPLVASLAMAGALLHIWNHALMKGLMFLSAGNILHGTGTRDMEQLGGLLKPMPWTGAAMITGALAIAALPPLNGLASKWLIYMTMLEASQSPAGAQGLTALFSVGLLALVGGLAAVSFVRLIGITLLGAPRSEAAAHAHESSPWMLFPVGLLVLQCLAVAIMPQAVVSAGRTVLEQLLGRDGSGNDRLPQVSAMLVPLGALNLVLLAAAGVGTFVWMAWARRSPRALRATWGCGYVQPSARMQYTGRSFAELFAEHLLPRWLRPRVTKNLPEGLFPATQVFAAHSPDPVSEDVYEPFFRRWAERFARLRILQQGRVNIYLLYIVLTIVLALAWTALRVWWRASG
jgi:formate hydrogenlyase subunit 3/multisubunit Na+/H+ antiporter MnhD subunit